MQKRSVVARLSVPSLAGLLGLLLVGVIGAGSAGAGSKSATQPLVVKVHADWCGTCTLLEPVWERLEAKYGEQARLVVFDVTDRKALDRANAKAQELGVGEFFARYKAKTGVIAVFEGGNPEPVTVLKGETDLAAYDEALRRAGVDRRS